MDYNQKYFDALYSKHNSPGEDQPALNSKDNDSNVIPYSILNSEDQLLFPLARYDELEIKEELLKDFNLQVLKMNAGLGTSVKRKDLIEKYDNRTTLGAKSTDLFLTKEETLSIAHWQVLQSSNLTERSSYKNVILQNVVNDETKEILQKIYSHPTIKSKVSNNLKLVDDLFQKKMPTLKEGKELSTERTAPCGHGLIGFQILNQIFSNYAQKNKTIYSIGNGEDLCSCIDEKIATWMIDTNTPIALISTNKTENDLKGGQLALVKSEQSYITIVEKAQAETHNQLKYFEELGLREGDLPALFNTNIIIINEFALSNQIEKYLSEMNPEEFSNIICPDVIRNVKEQDGTKFTQLEGAIASVILNYDKYMRVNHNVNALGIVNLEVKDRKKFFMPIKKREDYDFIVENFQLNDNYQLIEKS